ncbi:MAG: hypothetical protein ABR552_00535 [Actinomycetota bacterium]|nr:hypothetical protein [Actinomycetota bacterium]
MTRAALTLTVIVAALIAIPSVPALACSCAQRSIAQQFVAADAVFSGRALTIDSAPDEHTVTFEITGVYKKDTIGPRLIVHTAPDGAQCGVEFSEGSSYLVFTLTSGATNTTTLCSGTTDDVGVLDRAGYTSHPAAVAASKSESGAKDRGAAIAFAVVALFGVFSAHARRFRRLAR